MALAELGAIQTDVTNSSSGLLEIGCPIPFPLAVSAVEAQSQHVLRVGRTPPGTRALEPLLDDVTMRAFNLPRADRQTPRQRILIVQLFPTMTQISVAPAHRGFTVGHLGWLKVGL